MILSALFSVALAAPGRAPLGPLPVVWPEAAPAVALTVKFEDGLRARASGGMVTFARPHADLDAVVARWGIRFRPLVEADDVRVDALESRARARTGYATDLRGLQRVEVPGADRDTLIAVAAALDALDEVEWVHLGGYGWAPPGDIAPATDDYVPKQEWLGPDPGIDAVAAHVRGIRGAVGVADCEYDWNVDHEDLVDVDLGREEGERSPGYTDQYGYDQHGTAVAGMLVGVDNGYGVLGAAPDAIMSTWPEATVRDDDRRVTAIANAVAAAEPGDVVMLEMQLPSRPGGDYGPAEVDPAVYEVVRQATDAGVIVVAAAGNGDEDLDDAWYEDNWLVWGDSGAIIVGAGSADTEHDTQYFSTHGERVNLQGWGSDVFTTGYGDAYEPGNDINQAYTWFAGTSSATPMVAASVALVQDFRLQHGLPVLDAWEMRDLLVATGRPQGRGGNIGPLPDVAAILDHYDADGDDHVVLSEGGDDCADDDPEVHPGVDPALETPGVDLNCDGETPRKCGCETTGAGAPGLGVIALALLRRRARRGSPAPG